MQEFGSCFFGTGSLQDYEWAFVVVKDLVRERQVFRMYNGGPQIQKPYDQLLSSFLRFVVNFQRACDWQRKDGNETPVSVCYRPMMEYPSCRFAVSWKISHLSQMTPGTAA